MTKENGSTIAPFVDRRQETSSTDDPGRERRQFNNSYAELSPEAAELAHAIDEYKVTHRRRFVTFDEVLLVIRQLGYQK